MTNQEKIKLLEEMLNLEDNTLTQETVLDEVEEYDSLAKLSLIVLMEDEFNIKLTGQDVKMFKKVADILARMNEE